MLQLPFAHTWPCGQTLPHVPQLLPSDMVLAQPLEHWASPLGHWQLPVMQTCPPVHAVPHVPQLAKSVCRSAQLEPQGVWPKAQSFGAPPDPALPPELGLPPTLLPPSPALELPAAPPTVALPPEGEPELPSEEPPAPGTAPPLDPETTLPFIVQPPKAPAKVPASATPKPTRFNMPCLDKLRAPADER